MSRNCKAPDCDNELDRIPVSGYCSTVCMNVGIEVAARVVDRAAECGSIIRMEDLPDDKIDEIRKRNERSFARIQRKIDHADE